MTRLWMIERDVAGWTEEDLEAAAIRATMGVHFFEDMEWVRSYYDRGGERTICIYRAVSEEDVRKHATHCGLPCGLVLPVEEILPGEIAVDSVHAPASQGGREDGRAAAAALGD